jgi:hypothetical protein
LADDQGLLGQREGRAGIVAAAMLAELGGMEAWLAFMACSP